MALPRPAVRRTISLTVVPVATVLAVLLSVILLPLFGLADLVTRAPARRVRAWTLVVTTLVMECIGAGAAIALTVWHLGRLDGPVARGRFHRLERWWARRHGANFRRLGGLRWVVENPEECERGHAIVLARHASHADAILPVLIFACVYGHLLRYTLKEELQWAPAMDLVGNRLPNVFVDRTPGSAAEPSRQLEALAAGLEPDAVAVIFPEGTFYSAERLDRAATRLAQTRPDLEAAARSFEHLLPPRPAGTQALLRGAPDADLILLAHEGMEAFSDLAAIRRNLPLLEPVRVRLWRIDRADVPVDEDEFVTWLLDRWLELDRWISAAHLERAEFARTHTSPDGVVALLPDAEEIRP